MADSIDLNLETSEEEHLSKKMGTDRQEFSDKLVELLFSNIKTGATISIDAPYGYGKTYFITHLKEKIKEQNKESKGNKCTILSIDAWQTDWAPDPLIVIVDELLKLLEDSSEEEPIVSEDLKKFTNRLLLEIAPKFSLALVMQLIQKYAGIDVENLKDKVAEINTDQAVDYLKDFEEMKEKMGYITNALSDALEKCDGNIIVFVDELDRCRPRYIIDFLMRIKHIFNIPKLIFIISMNMEALKGACKSEFGEHKNANIDGYIERLFLPKLPLPPPGHGDLADSMLGDIIGGHLEKFHIFLDKLDVSPRSFHSARKYFDIIKLFYDNSEEDWVRPSMMYVALFHTIFSAEENQLIINGHSLWQPFPNGEESILSRLGIFEGNPATLEAAAFLHLCFLLPEEREVLSRFKKWYQSQESANQGFGHEVSGRKIPDEYLGALLNAVPQSASREQLDFLFQSGRKHLESLQTLRI